MLQHDLIKNTCFFFTLPLCLKLSGSLSLETWLVSQWQSRLQPLGGLVGFTWILREWDQMNSEGNSVKAAQWKLCRNTAQTGIHVRGVKKSECNGTEVDWDTPKHCVHSKASSFYKLTLKAVEIKSGTLREFKQLHLRTLPSKTP